MNKHFENGCSRNVLYDEIMLNRVMVMQISRIICNCDEELLVWIPGIELLSHSVWWVFFRTLVITVIWSNKTCLCANPFFDTIDWLMTVQRITYVFNNLGLFSVIRQH